MLKYVVLVMLIAQNSSNTLTVRYSLGIRRDVYSFSTVVVMVELVKLLFSMAMIHRSKPPNVSSTEVYQNLIYSSVPMSVPALIYFVQKLLSFIGTHSLQALVLYSLYVLTV